MEPRKEGRLQENASGRRWTGSWLNFVGRRGKKCIIRWHSRRATSFSSSIRFLVLVLVANVSLLSLFSFFVPFCLSWHPLLSGPPIAPTWHERRLYKRARATTCFLLSPPPLAATGTPGLSATLPPVDQRYFTRRFPITFSYTSLPFLHTSGVVLHVAFRCTPMFDARRLHSRKSPIDT